jgi:hypothetical protein
VARRILVGKMLISCSFPPLLDALRVEVRAGFTYLLADQP